MTIETLEQRIAYVPGKTLGRSGYVPNPIDRQADRIK
jgi:hypothetical protein